MVGLPILRRRSATISSSGATPLWASTREDDGGLVQGVGDLLLDVGGEVVDIQVAHAAGIDQLKPARADLHSRGNAVARDAGRGVDDGDAPSGKPVEQGGFTNVGTADDGNLRDRHGVF